MADLNEFTHAIPASTSPKAKKKMSDDMVDGIAALLLILIIVGAAVYWLSSLPDAY